MANNWKKQASVAYGCALPRMALNLYLYFESFPLPGEENEEEKHGKRYMELLGLFLEEKQEEVCRRLMIYEARCGSICSGLWLMRTLFRSMNMR